MTDWKEKFDANRQNKDREIQQSLIKRNHALDVSREIEQKTLNSLDVRGQLQSVKDSMWKDGDICTTENSISLVARWIKFVPSETRSRGSEYSDDIYISAYVGWREVAIEVAAVASDENNVLITFYDCKQSPGIRGIGNGSMRVNNELPITKEIREEFDGNILKILVRMNDILGITYPLSTTKEKDRQIIIEKVLSGELPRRAIPIDFGYNFPTEKTPQPTKQPLKKRGLFGF